LLFVIVDTNIRQLIGIT